MCSRRRSVAHGSHRLLPADADDDGEFTCDGCLVAGAGPRYLCGHPVCGFKLHEVCARSFPRTLKSIVHSQHRLKRRESAGDGNVRCEVCGEDVKGACYGCSAGGCASATVVVHPLCVRLPPVARGPAAAHPCGHDAWLVKKSDGGAAPASMCAASMWRGGTGAGRAGWTCTRGASCRPRTSAAAARRRPPPWGSAAASCLGRT
ncbi:hypothetical protein CFC21_070267 [Triticum aestivum]|uniref:DC1 domain-containing protein n=2 Tax=Triticum aestivum TaxID=4565 RepID=A0A3B6B0E2_WHEAT|nr:hypothetical protein CFC21_070267 [Triticum aestivum]